MTRVHSAVNETPFRVPHHLSTARPVGRASSLESSRPSTASSREPHVGRGLPTPAPVPLSGFLNPSAVSRQARVPRPCLMPQPFLNAPFRAFPSQRGRPPLGARLLPCGHPPTCEPRRLRRLIACGFPDARASRRSGLVPPPTVGPLSTSRSPLPGRPGQTNELGCSADFTRFEALLPLRIRSAPSGRTRTKRPLLSWSSPLQRRAVRTSDPRTRPRREDANTASARRPRRATNGTVKPRPPGEPANETANRPATASSAGPDPLRGRAAPALTGVSDSLDLSRGGRPPRPALGVSEYPLGAPTPAGPDAPLLGFLASSSPRSFGASPTRAHGFASGTNRRLHLSGSVHGSCATPPGGLLRGRFGCRREPLRA
jgi:hypothetical protein